MCSWALRAGLALALAGVWACGGGGSGSNSPGSPSPTAVTITILGERGNQSFSPNPATAAGQMVVFRNANSVVHRIRLNDLSIDTGDIAPGATSRAVQMPAAGTNYHCSLHPTMVGAVSSQSAPPPECTGQYC